MKYVYMALCLLVAGLPLHADTAQQRLRFATSVVRQTMEIPDKGIPRDLLNKAHCVIIIPGQKKGGFVVGVKYGRGFAVCRDQANNGWGAPAAVTVDGGSFGLQIGAENADVVMLVMSQRGMDRLLEDKLTLGGDIAVAAGPVGRDISAMTDVQLAADILTWSRSKGLYAGVVLTGETIRNDLSSNRGLYGKRLTDKEILMSRTKPPADATALDGLLNRYSPREAPNTPLTTRAQDVIKGNSNSADRSANPPTKHTVKTKQTQETETSR